MRQTGHTGLYIAAFCLFLAGIGALVLSGLGQNSVYFLNVSEALAMPRADLGAARLFGSVAGSRSEAGALSFELADPNDPVARIPVTYRGAVPDAFRQGSEVIVEGRMLPDGQFSAARLMTKCPSKYRRADSNS